VPFAEIDGVVLNRGRALFWASGKNEHVPGFRLVVMLKNGKSIPLTKDHRVGPQQIHDAAKKDILKALGLPQKD